MSSFLRWFTRVPFGLSAAVANKRGDARDLFDRVDAERLQLGEFRASGSMSFDEPSVLDFSDTLPSWSPTGASRDRPPGRLLPDRRVEHA